MRHQAWLNKHLQSLNGKKVVVTGASHGLGFFTSMQPAYKGAHVIMASRHKEKNDVAMQRILEHVPNAHLTYVPYDQSSFASIDDFVKRMKELHPIVDIIVLNAGIIMPPKEEVTPEGFPLQQVLILLMCIIYYENGLVFLTNVTRKYVSYLWDHFLPIKRVYLLLKSY